MHTIDMATTIMEAYDSLYSDLSSFSSRHKNSLAAITIEEKTLVYNGTAKKIGYYFLLHIDCLLLLCKRNVEASDIPTIRSRIDSFLAPACVCIDTFFICRIDYCKKYCCVKR